MDILQSSDFSEPEAKTIIAMLEFIISNSAKNNIQQEQLMKELIDLGIPKENCSSLCKILELNQEKIRNSFKQQVLRQNQFEDLHINKYTVLSSSDNPSKGVECFEFNLDIRENGMGKSVNRMTFGIDKLQLARFTDDMGAIMKIISGKEG